MEDFEAGRTYDLGITKNIIESNKVTRAPIPIIKKGRNNGTFGDNKVILNTLFYSQKEIKSSKPKLKEIDTEKDREIQILENIFHKRLSSGHIAKMSELMYSKGDPNYAQKRCNIKHTKLALNDQSDYYITFKTLYKQQNGYINSNEKENSLENYTPVLPKINTFSTIDNNNLTEQEQKEIFEKLRTKEKFQGNDQDELQTEIKYLPKNKYALRRCLPSDLGVYRDVHKINQKYSIIKKIHRDHKKIRLLPINTRNKLKSPKYRKLSPPKQNNALKTLEAKEMIYKIKGGANRCNNIFNNCQLIYNEVFLRKSDLDKSNKNSKDNSVVYN